MELGPGSRCAASCVTRLRVLSFFWKHEAPEKVRIDPGGRCECRLSMLTYCIYEAVWSSIVPDRVDETRETTAQNPII